MLNNAPGGKVEYELDKLPKHLHRLKADRVILIAERKAFGLHGKTVSDLLTGEGFEVVFIPFHGEEKNKTLMAAEAMDHHLLRSRTNRKTPIIALGGGVTTDLAGFVASTFMRGVPLFLIPTTLLAQVDAAIGGKNGVNLPEGKNLIGTFYFPEVTIVDQRFLRTLPLRELRCGFAEIVKMSILGGPKFFSDVETFAENGLGPEANFEPLVKKAVHGKIKVVERDPYETSGERAALNLGHTFAHAIETSTDYKKYSHGEAVSIGLRAACRLAEETNGFSQKLTRRIISVLEKCNLPVTYNGASPQSIFNSTAFDKKNLSGRRFILPIKLGDVRLMEGIPDEKILKVLEELKED